MKRNIIERLVRSQNVLNQEVLKRGVLRVESISSLRVQSCWQIRKQFGHLLIKLLLSLFTLFFFLNRLKDYLGGTLVTNNDRGVQAFLVNPSILVIFKQQGYYKCFQEVMESPLLCLIEKSHVIRKVWILLIGLSQIIVKVLIEQVQTGSCSLINLKQ